MCFRDGDKKVSNVLLIEPLKLQSLSSADKCKLLPSLLTYVPTSMEKSSSRDGEASRVHQQNIRKISHVQAEANNEKENLQTRNLPFPFNLSPSMPIHGKASIIINEFII